MDIRKNLFRALELKYEADKQVAKANLDVLLEYQVGVADHPKFIETIDKLLKDYAEASELLTILQENFREFTQD
jgi:hypothetical protein|tara:strand:+ start:955 stop:1176 length:222 start_codon:yes stop_codon:yes gene_type:complete